MLIVAADRSGVEEGAPGRSCLRQVANHDIPPFFRYLHEGNKLVGWNGHPWAKERIAITISYYHKTPLHYARTVANSGESAMLINKRRFTRAL